MCVWFSSISWCIASIIFTIHRKPNITQSSKKTILRLPNIPFSYFILPLFHISQRLKALDPEQREPLWTQEHLNPRFDPSSPQEDDERRRDSEKEIHYLNIQACWRTDILRKNEIKIAAKARNEILREFVFTAQELLPFYLRDVLHTGEREDQRRNGGQGKF